MNRVYVPCCTVRPHFVNWGTSKVNFEGASGRVRLVVLSRPATMLLRFKFRVVADLALER